MAAILRESSFGQVCFFVFGSRAFQYPDQDGRIQSIPSKTSSIEKQGLSADDPERAQITTSNNQGTPDKNTVDWYSPSDPENPQNWSTPKKCFTFGQICILTFTVYIGSAIITPAEPTFVSIYGVSGQVSSLVLSMYVLGYGTGPLFFSPLSEVPRLGRNIPYMTSFTLFILITIGTACVQNYAGLVVLRFIQGLLGGPVLATGGASAGDILGFHKIPYGLTLWFAAAYGGPALGPLLSGFAVEKSTWRWSMYEMLILSGAVWILLFFCLPETNPDTILLKRARRLRTITRNESLQSQSEIKQGDIHLLKVMGRYLTTPFKVTVQDPSVAFINVYTALVYGIYVRFLPTTVSEGHASCSSSADLNSSTPSSNPFPSSTHKSTAFRPASWESCLFA